MKYTKQDVLRLVQEEDVEFIRHPSAFAGRVGEAVVYVLLPLSQGRIAEIVISNS